MSLLNLTSGVPVSWYVIATLAASLSASVWFNKHQSEEIGGLKVAQASYVSALAASEKQQENRDLSCKQDDKAVSELEAEKIAITSGTDSISEQLAALRMKENSSVIPPIPTTNSITPIVKKKDNPTRENANAVKQDDYLPDDGKLSPTVLGLLNKSFCSAEPTDSSCVSP